MHILYYTYIVYHYVFLFVSVLCSNYVYIIHNMNIDCYNEINLPFYKVLD